MDYYYSTETAATENAGVMHKPNYQESPNMNSLNGYSPESESPDEEDNYEMNPSTPSHLSRPLRGDDDFQMPSSSGSERGGNNDDGPRTSADDGGGNGYKNSPQFEKPTSNNPEGLPVPDDFVFIPAPPSQSFIAEIEYDSATGTLHEKGLGGLYDNDQDSTDYFDGNSQDQEDHQRDNNNEQDQYRRGYGYDQGERGPGENNERFNGYESVNRNREFGEY